MHLLEDNLAFQEVEDGGSYFPVGYHPFQKYLLWIMNGFIKENLESALHLLPQLPELFMQSEV